MTLVKICGITNLEDAQAAASAGADALGFNFYRRSPRFIEPAAALYIIEQLPENVLCVGVFVNEQGPEDVIRLVREARVGAVQLHGDETPEYCAALKDLFVIKAVPVRDDFNAESLGEYDVDAIMLDAFDRTARGGTGKRINWATARRASLLVPKLFLAGGLSPENVSEAIQTVAPYAVDACSSLEISPGRKDHERVRAFIRAAHADSTVKP